MSFRLKTVLGVALIEAALLLILVLVSLHELRHIGQQQLLQRAQTTATLFATTTADAVLASDLASLESFVQEVLKNPGLVYARVRGDGQTLAADGERSALERAFAADTDLAQVDDGTFDTFAEITVGGERFGRVEIGLEIEHLNAQLARATQTFSGIAVSELVLSALFSLALGALLTTQLRSLIAGTKAVGEGRFGYQLKSRGNDEIAQAVRAFNRMSSDLAQLMNENVRQRDELRSASELLGGLVDKLQSGILMVDMQGKVMHVNAGFLAMFGVGSTGDELRGRRYADVLSAMLGDLADPVAAQVELDAIVARGEACKNRLFEMQDGRHIETDYLPLVANGVQYAHLWNHCDVTARVIAQRQVQERRRQLDTVFDLSPDGFVHFGADQCVTSVNPAFTKMTGVASDQAVGTHRYQFFALLRKHCGITDIDDSEGYRLIRIVRPRPLTLSCFERSLRGERGNDSAHVMYFRDVTVERELDWMKSDFLAAAAHELHAPLARMHGHVELLAEYGHDQGTRRGMIKTILDQSAHLETMLNELVDLARIEARAGKEFDIRRQPLLPLIRQVVDAYAPSKAGRALDVDLPHILPAVPVDASKFNQLLRNVLNNAFSYSAGSGDVQLAVSVERGAVRITVVDHGIGMTKDQLDAVFDRFFRADKSGEIPGTGLGMSLVKEIARFHHWEVRVDSQYGEGTRVTLIMPVETNTASRLDKAG